MADDPMTSAATTVVGTRYVIQPSGVVPITTWVPAFSWVCNRCGWLGGGHMSEGAAEQEAERHWKDEHGD